MHFVHLKTSGLLRLLRARDRIVRSNKRFIHSLPGKQRRERGYFARAAIHLSDAACHASHIGPL